MADQVKSRPIKVFHCGAVKAAIGVDDRRVDNTVVQIHSIQITKSYKDGDDWRHTSTLAVDDLPKAVTVLTEAYRFIRVWSEEPDNPAVDRQPANANSLTWDGPDRSGEDLRAESR